MKVVAGAGPKGVSAAGQAKRHAFRRPNTGSAQRTELGNAPSPMENTHFSSGTRVRKTRVLISWQQPYEGLIG